MIPLSTSLILFFSSAMDHEQHRNRKPAEKWLLSSNHPGDKNSSHPIPSGMDVIRYRSELDAVFAAGNFYNPASIQEDREFIGAILQHKNEHYFRYTVAAGDIHKNRISAEITIPKGYKIIAFWHTHGAGSGSRHFFSPTDTALVRQWQKPFYLIDSSGVLKIFRPGDRTINRREAREAGITHYRGIARGVPIKDSRGLIIKIKTGE